MIGGIAWPDLLFVLVVLFAVVKGFTRGFVKELGGLVAFAAAAIAPWYYNGAADLPVAKLTGLGVAPAHAVCMLGTSIFAYVIVMIAVWIVGTIVKLPILGIGNKIAGAFVGFVKAYLFLWAVLYVALFFPLTPQVRAALHGSSFAPFFTAYDDDVNRGVLAVVPSFAKPYLEPYVKLHRL